MADDIRCRSRDFFKTREGDAEGAELPVPTHTQTVIDTFSRATNKPSLPAHRVPGTAVDSGNTERKNVSKSLSYVCLRSVSADCMRKWEDAEVKITHRDCSKSLAGDRTRNQVIQHCVYSFLGRRRRRARECEVSLLVWDGGLFVMIISSISSFWRLWWEEEDSGVGGLSSVGQTCA